MNIFRKAIFTAASPNTQMDDALLALRVLFQPWSWRNKKYTDSFGEALKNYLNIKHINFTDSGRSSLYTILKAIKIQEGDEVITPSFTCVVVANAVKWSGATPRYLDTNESDFNPDYSTLKEIITPKTKAILIQHTFGKMVDVDEVKKTLKSLKREDIILIEDFAHVIKRNLKLSGDYGFLTFGIEKVISSVRGGAIITNTEQSAALVQAEVSRLRKMPYRRVLISLLNPIFWWIDIPLHSVGIGRFTIGALIRSAWRKLGFLGIMVEDSENRAVKPDWFPVKISPVLARLGEKQLSKLDRFNEHRTKISKIYHKYLNEVSDDKKELDMNRVYLRYPILLHDITEFNKVWNLSRRLRVTLGNWFASPLYGSEVDDETYKELCYVPATTPVTAKKCGLTLNLPTSVNMSERRAEELARAIKKVVSR